MVAGVALLLAIATAGLWGASVLWFPHVRGPWPGSGEQTYDRGIICILDGRLMILRRRAMLVSDAPDMRLTSEVLPVPPNAPHGWPPPTPRVRVDLVKVNAVVVQDYSVRPPAFAPEGYQSRNTERDSLTTIPWGWFGFDFGRNKRADRFTIGNGHVRVQDSLWAVPLWPLLLVASVPVALFLWRNRQSQRWARAGCCPDCGYDLRESPGRCPECGREAVSTATMNRP